MLTDAALRNLKPKDKAYKVTDRDGLYVYVLKSGTWAYTTAADRRPPRW